MDYEITFYYQIQDRFLDVPYIKEKIYAVKRCKAPKRTKIWQELQRKLDADEVVRIGYKTNP